ncbi:hypothetical protein M595_4827 [Lyngbya aestuarii BL J]|uniref:Uncharacterized protein n=1 Tax=Lyngbya aestuarii BL J TaxID=1348334 RepID=U7QBI1_9CYAN|nr:hypothetical protein M595_4827 [Lyngbya aestuarii BL J]
MKFGYSSQPLKLNIGKIPYVAQIQIKKCSFIKLTPRKS